MAELATIARPYAEALFKATPVAEQAAWLEQAQALWVVARDPQLQDFADNPKVTQEQVFDVIAGAAKVALAPAVANFLRTVLENGRLAALPLMVEQYQSLVQARQGVSEAHPRLVVEAGDLFLSSETVELYAASMTEPRMSIQPDNPDMPGSKGQEVSSNAGFQCFRSYSVLNSFELGKITKHDLV